VVVFDNSESMVWTFRTIADRLKFTDLGRQALAGM
jgi:hypothetical protein